MTAIQSLISKTSSSRAKSLNQRGQRRIKSDHKWHKTAAELPAHEKNLISHRGKALAALASRLRRDVRGEA